MKRKKDDYITKEYFDKALREAFITNNNSLKNEIIGEVKTYIDVLMEHIDERFLAMKDMFNFMLDKMDRQYSECYGRLDNHEQRIIHLELKTLRKNK